VNKNKQIRVIPSEFMILSALFEFDRSFTLETKQRREEKDLALMETEAAELIELGLLKCPSTCP